MRAIDSLAAMLSVLAVAGPAGCAFSAHVAGEPTGAGGAAGVGGSSGSGAGGSQTGGMFVDPFGGMTGTAGATAGGTGGASGSNGKMCLSDQTIDCVPVTTCGLETVAIAKLPPEILIVFDKSVSMVDPATGGSCGMPTPCGSKMMEMVNAVSTVVMQTQTTIDWGLKLFADMGACGVAVGPTVPVAPMNGAAISQALSVAKADSHTPTRTAMQAAVAYLQTLMTPNPKYVLLATDGIPNCIPNNKNQIAYDQAGATQAVADSVTAGYPVFVLGVGSGVTSNPSDAPIFDPTLTMLATAGGRPRAGTPNYYHASSSADVVAALATIQSQAGSCVFTLGKVPPDPTNIAVRGDNNVHIPKDPAHLNGWDYAAPDMKSIQLYGTWCDQVTAGTLKSVQAIFGCPMLIIP